MFHMISLKVLMPLLVKASDLTIPNPNHYCNFWCHIFWEYTETKLDAVIIYFRSEDLSDHCSHMVKQAVVLTKVGLWYKQMLEARRSELQKAEAKVFICLCCLSSGLYL